MQTFTQTFVPILCRFLHKKLVINSSDFFCVPYLKKKRISKYMFFSLAFYCSRCSKRACTVQAGMTHRKCISTAQSVASSSTCASSRVHQCSASSVCCSPTIRGRVFSVTPLLPLWWLVMGDVAPVCMARQSNAEQYRDCKREIMAARVQSVISGRAQKRRMFPLEAKMCQNVTNLLQYGFMECCLCCAFYLES